MSSSNCTLPAASGRSSERTTRRTARHPLAAFAALALCSAPALAQDDPPALASAPILNPPSAIQNPKWDPYGDSLSPGVMARIGTSRLLHSFFLQTIAFSPDGKSLASGSADGVLCVSEVPSGRTRLRIEQKSGEGGSIDAVAFSPDGKFLAYSDFMEVYVRDAASAGEPRVLQGHTHIVKCLAFSPDGKTLISGGLDGAICWWDPATGEQIHAARNLKAAVQSLALSPDGKTLASGEEKAIRFWEVSAYRELRRIAAHEGDAACLSFSPDGRFLVSAGGDKTLRFWDAVSGEARWMIESDVGPVWSFAIAPDGRTLATGEGDRTIRLWAVDEAGPAPHVRLTEVRQLQGHAGRVTLLAFSPDGRLLGSGSYGDWTIQFWDVATGRALFKREGHLGVFYVCGFADDGRTFITSGEDKTLRQWDVFTGRLIRTLPPCEGLPYDGKLSPDGTLWATTSYEPCRLFAVQSGLQVRELPDTKSSCCRATAFSPDGRLLIGEARKTLHLWSVATGTELLAIPGDDREFVSVAMSADHRYLAGRKNDDGGTTRLWEIGTDGSARREASTIEPRLKATEIRSFQTHQATHGTVTFSPDGRWLVVGSSERLVFWDVVSGRELHRLSCGRQHSVCRHAFSPDGSILAMEWDRASILLWEPASGKEIGLLHAEEGAGGPVGFSPDGRLLAAASRRSVVLMWDVTLGQWNAGLGASTVDPHELGKLWDSLDAADLPKAYAAAWRLAALGSNSRDEVGKPTLALLRDRLHIAPSGRVRQLIADLDRDDPTVRSAAQRELERLGDLVEGELRAALDATPSAEVRARIHALMDAIRWPFLPPGEPLRRIRAIHVLERIGTPEARSALDAVAKDSPSERERRDAGRAIERLKARSDAVEPRGRGR